MARSRPRPERRPGRQSREPVPASWSSDDSDPFFGEDDPDDGSAGVREPRRPKPLGPRSDAGARPVPEPEIVAVLPDPRHCLSAPR